MSKNGVTPVKAQEEEERPLESGARRTRPLTGKGVVGETAGGVGRRYSTGVWVNFWKRGESRAGYPLGGSCLSGQTARPLSSGSCHRGGPSICSVCTGRPAGTEDSRPRLLGKHLPPHIRRSGC